MDFAVECRQVVLYEAATVTGETIPDEQNGPIDLFVQMSDKVQDFFLAHGSFVQAEVELPEGHTGGDGEVVPVELMLQDRRDAAPGPSAYSMRPLAEAALVYEDDDSALLLGFFLSSGQIFSFQSRIAASLRSRARPIGRWQLHLSFSRRIRHTCEV